tara:strand:+ start:1107 stop:1808 length:702 start_codon:yes stop_codon:yes gene_type:complete
LILNKAGGQDMKTILKHWHLLALSGAGLMSIIGIVVVVFSSILEPFDEFVSAQKIADPKPDTAPVVETTSIKYETDIPVTSVPAYYKFNSGIPVLRNNGLILEISITELFDNGSIKQLKSKFLEGTDFSSFTDVQRRVIEQAKENATHLFKFNYEWIRIQTIVDPTRRQQETDILVEGILTALRYGDISNTSVENLIDNLELLVRDKLLQINFDNYDQPPARLTERFFLLKNK